MKIIRVAVLGVVLIVLLVGSGAWSIIPATPAVAQARKMTLIFAHITQVTFPYHDGALKFKELVERASGGSIEVKVFPAAQLGAERETNESILEGSVHIGVGAGALGALAPIVNLFELPFLIKGQDHLRKIAESNTGKVLAQKIEQQANYKVLGWFSTGDSALQTTKAPVRTPADLRGVKIRVIENPALVDAMRALGANPTPMPFPEIYTGLKQGVIEGAHLDWGSVVSTNVYELIKYTTGPGVAVLASLRPVITSARFWKGLNQQEQDLIQKAMDEATAYERRVFVERQPRNVEIVRRAGVTFTEIDEAAFAALLRPVWTRWERRLAAGTLIQQILGLR